MLSRKICYASRICFTDKKLTVELRLVEIVVRARDALPVSGLTGVWNYAERNRMSLKRLDLLERITGYQADSTKIPSTTSFPIDRLIASSPDSLDNMKYN